MSTVELRDVLESTGGDSFPGTLVQERATDAFNFYRIETEIGVYGRYRTPADQDDLGAPRDAAALGVKIGERITLTGRAANAKLGPVLEGPATLVFVDLERPAWPASALGREVQVTGTLIARFDLPVFIDDPASELMAGVPVPPGTDRLVASRRLVLIDVRWHLMRGS